MAGEPPPPAVDQVQQLEALRIQGVELAGKCRSRYFQQVLEFYRERAGRSAAVVGVGAETLSRVPTIPSTQLVLPLVEEKEDIGPPHYVPAVRTVRNECCKVVLIGDHNVLSVRLVVKGQGILQQPLDHMAG